MVSNLYLCPWDGVVWRAGGHDGAQQIADCLMWCAAGHSRELAASFNSVVKVPHMSRKPIHGLWMQGSGERPALSPLLLMHFSFSPCKVLRYAILPFLLVTFSSLISFHLVLPLLTPAHSCTRSLASEIRQPIGRRHAEVGSASLLIPPLEWITKWK